MTRLSKALLLAMLVFALLLTASAFALTADVTMKVNGALPNGSIQMIAGADNILEFWITNSAKIKGMSLGFELSNHGLPFSLVQGYGNIPYEENADGEQTYDSTLLMEHGTANNFKNSFGLGNLALDRERSTRDTIFFGGVDATSGQTKNIAIHLTSTLAYSVKIRIPAGQAPGPFCVKPIFIPPAGAWMIDAGTNPGGGAVNPDFQGAPTLDSGDPGVNPVCFGPTGPSNTAPVVSDIPDQTVAEGGAFVTISLDNYVSDSDNTDAEMTWTYSGNAQLMVSIVNRVATITIPNADWTGSETITFRATDPDSLFDSDPATFTVTAVNNAPVVSDIPDQTIAEGGAFVTINLDSYVTDAESADNLINWTATSASPNGFTVNINATTRVATISFPGGEFSGSALFTFTATDPGALSASDTARFTVTPVNDAPVVAGIPDQILSYGATFATINLDNYVTDPDNTDAEMTWSYSGNSQLTVAISGARVATITKPSADWNGSESIIFTATDPGLLSDSDTATFSIAAPAPIIKITPDTLTFTAYAGGSNPAGQGAMITNTGTGTLDWNASEATAWLTLSSTSGTAPSGFTDSVDIAGLAPGSYFADVTVTAAGASNSPQVLKVILHINSPVDIKLTPDSLSFYARRGGANPPSKDVTITNAMSSGVEFNWDAIETSPWLSMTATTGTSPSTVSFSADITDLTPGTYNTLVEIKQVSLKAGVIDDIDTIYVKLLVDQPTGVDDDHSAVPKSYSLKQNYPNPFNPETMIEYNLAASGHVTMTVFNVIGQKVVDVVNGYESAGNKQAVWNGRDENGREVQSGVYFYRLTTENFSMTRKMMLLK